MKPLIIFGTGQLAQLAQFYFSAVQHRNIVAFCLDAQYIKSTTFNDLPVIPYDEITTQHPAAAHDMFIAIGSSQINTLREQKYHDAKKRGYTLATCVSKNAVIHTHTIGDNCLIMDCNNIHPFTQIGNNVIFSNDNHIGHHTTIEDHCFITSNVVVGGGTTIGKGSFLGINATIRDHITIGAHNIIGAGALILNDTPDNSVYTAEQTAKRAITSDKVKGL